MLERGLVVGGQRVRGTGWIIRDSDAWWQPGERGTRARAPVVDRVIGHWTAGHPRKGPSAGPRTAQAMKARRRPDGSLMNVGINFVISWDGLIWQTADLLTATTHVGLGPVNAASVGVEVCNPGTGRQMRALGYDLPTHEVRIAGRRVEVVTPPQAVFDTWEALVELLCSLTGQFEGVNIPRVTLSDKTKRLSRAEAIRTKGVLEHCNLPGTKIDAGGLLAGCLTF